MTGEPPYFPPPEPIPQGPIASGTTPMPSPAPPPPTQPLPPVPLRTPNQAAKSNKRWVIGGVIFGGLLIVGLLVGASAVLISLAGHFGHPAVQPPVAGAPGSTTASDPVVCPEKCFFDAPESAIPPQDVFDAFQLTRATETWGQYGLTNAQLEFDDSLAQWNSDGGTPDACFVVYGASPIAYPLGSRPEAPADGVVDDAITFAGTHTDRHSISSLTQTIRVFPSSQAAEDHVASLDVLLQRCHAYSANINGADWDATVSREPALDLPGSVAAVGWVETADQGRFYVFDLQRSNMVIRSSLYTDGSITEQQFRSFETSLAERLDNLQIAVSDPYVPPSGCDGTCLTVDQAAQLTPAATSIGATLTPDPANNSLAPTTIGPLWDAASATYAKGNGDPYGCFFTLSTAPISPLTQEYLEHDDPALDLGTFSDGSTTLRETAHVYVAEIYAGRYIRTLTSPVKQCAHFSYETDGQKHEATLIPEKFDTGSAAVESAAWKQVADGVTTTVVDLRYRNVAIRITVDQQTGSKATRAQIAQQVLDVSSQLQGLG